MLTRPLRCLIVALLFMQLCACSNTQPFKSQQDIAQLQTILKPGQQVQIQTWDNQTLDITIKKLDQHYIYFEQQHLSWKQIKQVEYQQLEIGDGLAVTGATSIVVLSVYALAAVMAGVFL